MASLGKNIPASAAGSSQAVLGLPQRYYINLQIQTPPRKVNRKELPAPKAAGFATSLTKSR